MTSLWLLARGFMLNTLVISRSFIWHSDKELVPGFACFMDAIMARKIYAKAFGTLTKFALLTMLFSISGAEMAIPPLPKPQRIAIRAEQIDVGTFAARRVKGLPLTLTSAWELTSDTRDFGGLSALAIMPLGMRAVSDNGAMFDFQPDSAVQTWPGRLVPLAKGCVSSSMKSARDTESIARDPATQRIWLGMEFRNVLCRLSPNGARTLAPPAMKSWLRTGGPEAMARLADGRFLVFAEHSPDQQTTSPALLFPGDPFDVRTAPAIMAYSAPQGYAPVDAAQLPDGRLLVLHRRFRLLFRFSALISIVTLKDGTLTGEPIFWLDRENGAENWEALAVQDEGQGRASIWLASDDNFLPVQRTYLLKLKWQGPWPQP